MKSVIKFAACGLLVLQLCACAIQPIQPWVKPYERERLANPVMNPARSALAQRDIEHARDVREGARGATGVQGGGCGCN
jgi:hypothetical protein